jgi:hypothetical protein
MITPKALFLKLHKEDAAKLAAAVNESWLQRAITYACAELSSQGVSDQQLAGVNRFIDVLTSLADEPKEPAQMPDKSQLKSYNK